VQIKHQLLHCAGLQLNICFGDAVPNEQFENGSVSRSGWLGKRVRTSPHQLSISSLF
jgi:hypothetical protein